MCDTDDINSKICHVRGPEGERVVIVPAKQERYGKPENICTRCCLVLSSIAAFFLFVMGIIFLALTMTMVNSEDSSSGFNYGNENGRQVISNFIMITSIMLLLGGAFLLLILLLVRCIRRDHRERTKRFMYRNPDGERQPVLQDEGGFGEEVDPEAFERSYEMYIPE